MHLWLTLGSPLWDLFIGWGQRTYSLLVTSSDHTCSAPIDLIDLKVARRLNNKSIIYIEDLRDGPCIGWRDGEDEL